MTSALTWSGLDLGLRNSRITVWEAFGPHIQDSQIQAPSGHRPSWLREKTATRIGGIIGTTAKGGDNGS